MNLEDHFEEQTPYIQIDGKTPLTNSLPYEEFYLGEVHIKAYKKYKKQYPCQYFMSVSFEKKPPLKSGDIVQWKLHEDEYDIIILKYGELFVKGKRVHAYTVGILK